MEFPNLLHIMHMGQDLTLQGRGNHKGGRSSILWHILSTSFYVIYFIFMYLYMISIYNPENCLCSITVLQRTDQTIMAVCSSTLCLTCSVCNSHTHFSKELYLFFSLLFIYGNSLQTAEYKEESANNQMSLQNSTSIL